MAAPSQLPTVCDHRPVCCSGCPVWLVLGQGVDGFDHLQWQQMQVSLQPLASQSQHGKAAMGACSTIQSHKSGHKAWLCLYAIHLSTMSTTSASPLTSKPLTTSPKMVYLPFK